MQHLAGYIFYALLSHFGGAIWINQYVMKGIKE